MASFVRALEFWRFPTIEQASNAFYEYVIETLLNRRKFTIFFDSRQQLSQILSTF
jgi:hypothetical protein